LRAAVYTRYGPPEVLEIKEVAKPVPRDNEVLVSVHAATVCTPDWRFRRPNPFFIRFMTGLWKPKKARILGMEFSGTVESAGKNVSRFRAGDQIFGSTGFQLGTHAEYVCVPENGTVALKPANMSLEESAAILFGGFSALHFLRMAGIQAGQNVLIYGGSGSVGVFAVQLAKHFGARVTAVCSTTNLELMKSLGADEVVDYTKADFSRAGRVYDIVFDTVGKSGISRSLRGLKRGGALVQGGYSGLGSLIVWSTRSKWASLTGAAKPIGGMVRGTPEDQTFLKRLIEAGKLRTVIDRRYTLDQIREAHRHAEGGHKKGHVIVLMARP